ncbi:alpha/beta hydrolase [Flagellimonas allohymeniacidonis]|uniref:Alpha/beta hydrolase n=1 Tax=Flagellimonas allohymeniacidonis TaxID=2517819 RepID=A0A4Q8QFX2_9FLAO|nr:alpha/beta hydrolase [Allomuricauda hymeniacidonis]TAI47006.1 alpha/beta hydrolase [Allomuricauda hymeniacidonis]
MKIALKIVKVVVGILFLLGFFYVLGPKVEKPNLDTVLPEVETNLLALEKMIQEREQDISNLKPDNEARIIWFDSIPAKTEYCIVYLHGWSASQGEGSPLHTNIAKKYGCNLYLPRLAGHGIFEKEPMLTITADALIDSAKEAIAIGKQLGKKVILMATSTGGTLALHLAQEDSDIAGMLLYSPNVEIYDKNAKLLAGPWGVNLAKIVKQSDYHEFEANEARKKYWTHKYRVEALTHLQALVDNTMVPETFEKITQPVFMGYFYKNDSIQDKVVSVPAMLEMFEQLGTKSNEKRKVAFPESNNHVMTSYITSKDLASVEKETQRFLEEILKMKSIDNQFVVEKVEKEQLQVHRP